MWELARAYYECSARGTVDQQGAGTEHSHGHDVGPESSPNHRHQTHEDERPREKNRDPVIISFLCAHTPSVMVSFRAAPHRTGLNMAMKQATGLATDAMVAARW